MEPSWRSPVASNPTFKPVKEVLPHREPFLFLDEVLEMTETRIVAQRTVRSDEPQFKGHYPHRPIMPGVLLCETVIQAGAYLAAEMLGLSADMGGAPVVGRMNSVKFKRMVAPGDVLTIYAEHDREMMGAHFMKGRIKRDGKLVCSLEFAVMHVKEDDLGD